MRYRVVQFTHQVTPLPLNPDVNVTLSGLFMTVLKETETHYTGYIFYHVNRCDYGIEIVIDKQFTQDIGYTSYVPHLDLPQSLHLN